MKLIPSMNSGVVQTFGKFSRIAHPGLNIYLPFVQSITLVSNRLCENNFKMQVRTHDKVFPTLDIAMQYRVHPEDSAKAYFEMSDPINQMISYTENTVRRIASSLTLDQLFESQSEIADAIIESVSPKMKEGGFTIESSQVRNIQPPDEVLRSMNEINASERRKIAAKNDGEAAKIKAVLMAEADAQEKSLRGKGVADMRNNITEGWAHSIASMSKETGVSPKDTLEFMLKVLQQETMETMAKNAGTKVIFVDKNAEMEQRQSIMEALEAYQHKGKADDVV